MHETKEISDYEVVILVTDTVWGQWGIVWMESVMGGLGWSSEDEAGQDRAMG